MADVTLTPLTKPFSPSVNQQQPKKPYQVPIQNKTDGTVRLQNDEVDYRSDVQLLPQARKKIEPIGVKETDDSFIKSQKVTFKENEIELKKSELPFVSEEERDRLQSEIYQLNLKLDELKKSDKGPNIQGAKFRLNEDDDGFYVELINVDQDVVIKELSEESFEDILRQTSDTETMGILLDLFA